ncbi:hypothetical protein E2C01_000448 [Portunus trituberculatus]|uniref:Secreted protein n=1 Tax=Portunus trituberculatus TaxID=210409 RepID=A0A5B7CGG8_PORTR|nr:hypothetical protein [Portunus trituberculatus]
MGRRGTKKGIAVVVLTGLVVEVSESRVPVPRCTVSFPLPGPAHLTPRQQETGRDGRREGRNAEENKG